ncbi:coiled-coil domain-containing protein 116 [Fukomys damarensis]|uniref:coiled-coil domain-containing protein 116 n=1 Tax=Fukomys damarensis TaxID=885580 RepID=UPI00053F898C|nr:coiled-coil domain-containing protein 116 [Fukomys damarensis]
MAGCRHHSGYLADDEAAHSTCRARVPPPKKPLLPEMGPAIKLGRVPHTPSAGGGSAHRGYCQAAKRPQAFGSFLDFLTEGQVLDSLQTVVEEATERLATMKTEAGVPLVEVQDPTQVPGGKRQARARPSFSTVRRHRARPTLCTGHPNNYPSCSSSASHSRSSLTAGRLGSHSRDSDLGPQGLGSLPPMRDRLLLEKNLKRLLQLENKGRGWSQPCSQRDSLLWNSPSSQTASQWTQEQPLSWFSGLLGSSSGTPEASEPGPGEQELIFLKGKSNKEREPVLSQPTSLDLPGYCVLREPHRTLDFLAKHRLFPALQSVVSQAADKLRGARCRDGCPLFPTNSQLTSAPPLNHSQGLPDSKPAEGEEPSDSLHTTVSNPKLPHRKSKNGLGSPVSSAQVANRFKFKSSNTKFTKKPLPSISPKSSVSHLSNPCFEEIISFLVEQAVSLLTLKYKYEKSLQQQLGFVSFPVTEALVDLFLGFKEVKGSRIRLSSGMDWSCLLRKLHEAERALQASQVQGSQVSSGSSKPGSHRVHTLPLGASRRSTKSSSLQPMPATSSSRDQVAELGLPLDAETSIHQLLGPLQPVAAERQDPKSLSQPGPFVSPDQSAGSSLPNSIEIEDNRSNAETEAEDSTEDKDEGVDLYKDDGHGPEATVRRSADVGHSDPP